MLLRNPDKINWSIFCRNTNSEAIKIIEQNIDNPDLNWEFLSENPSAIDLLKKNKDKIVWTYLCKNPNAIEIINDEDNFNNIHWWCLSSNQSAIDILEKHEQFIHYDSFSKNPAIFEYDYESMKTEMWKTNGIGEQLMQWFWKPERVFSKKF